MVSPDLGFSGDTLKLALGPSATATAGKASRATTAVTRLMPISSSPRHGIHSMTLTVEALRF